MRKAYKGADSSWRNTGGGSSQDQFEQNWQHFGNKQNFTGSRGRSRGNAKSNLPNDGKRDFDHREKHNECHGAFKKTRLMGFRNIEGLLIQEDLEDVIFKLTNDKAGFKELLENVEISNDMTVLLVKLLAKICACHFTESKLHLLQTAMNSNFVGSLMKLISTLAIQSEKDKQRNSSYWKQPDEFFSNVFCISRTLNDLIPTTYCELNLKILKAMKIYIPLIEFQHSISIPSLIKGDIDTLLEIIEKKSAEVEAKRISEGTSGKPCVEEPPNDFREINVYPSVVEVTTSTTPFLRPNVIRGPYQNVNHYLDIQFRLLREDFIAPVRNGICKFLANPKERLDNIRVYRTIRFLNRETVNEQNCYRIQYDFSKKKKKIHFENSRRFMFGSLICFTNDNFMNLIFGKIVQRNVADLENGQLIVGFDEENILPDNVYELNYLMVESSIYFEPYYHVLKVLKTMQTDNFPMERYVIRVKNHTRPPQYLLKIDPVFYEIEKYTFWPLNWDDRIFYGLNNAQNQAFRSGLTQEFSIIQGPPGTGKTFLGLKIAEALLNNKLAWYNKTPMLVICYTNHALDQFLEGLLSVTDDIVRVGSQSKNEKLSRFNLKTKRRLEHSNPTVMQMRQQVKECLGHISYINDILKNIDLNDSVIDFSRFRGVVPYYNDSWFRTASSENILKWLLGGQEITYRMQRNKSNYIQNQNASNNSKHEREMEEEMDLHLRDMFNEFDDADFIASNFKDISLLVSLKSLNEIITILNNNLEWLHTNTSERDNLGLFEIEEYLIKLNTTNRNLQYLKRRLMERPQENFLEMPPYVNLQNPHQMPPSARWQLYWFWLDQYKLKLLEIREKLTIQYGQHFKRYDELAIIEDTQIMKKSLVVGLTTTAAARLQTSLRSLKNPIVIVEEAAEVLEAHVLCSLTNHCQHLILIGDHQQLKPSTADFKIETKYHLGISLFERMVLNKIHCHKLNVQHRMRPEISCLIRPAIYPVLEDHESVLNRPPTLGIEGNIYFIDHQELEQVCQDDSKKNVHESKFLINLAKYLVLNGHHPEKITILAAYLGQMFEMQHEKKLYDPLLQHVRIAVLDNYQGEENDIILLSLVRSNAENKIGFLKNENRVCVALSRARNSLYVIGNMSQLCNNSDIWPKVRESLKQQNAFGPYLTLRCQIHRDNITKVKNADDFMNVAEGGYWL